MSKNYENGNKKEEDFKRKKTLKEKMFSTKFSKLFNILHWVKHIIWYFLK